MSISMDRILSSDLHEVEIKVGSDPNETREAFMKRVEVEGLIVCLPEKDELMIDIDNEQQYEVFLRSFEIMEREFNDDALTLMKVESPSKSGLPCRHIRIHTGRNLSDVERIAWQAALGSDPIREILSMIRWMRHDFQPTLLVEKP